MLMILLSVWTCVLIFAWLVRSKFRNSEFDGTLVVAFVPAGFFAVLCAGEFNSNVILASTPLHFTEGPILYRLGAFLLGPGMGEEFFKMSMGLIMLLFLTAVTRRVKDSTRIIGMVIVGLTFAALENLLVYSTMVDEIDMIKRGYLAVPLHACCGMIHGYAANRSYARARFWPLLAGYFAAVGIHTAYDTVDIQLAIFLKALGLQEIFRNIQLPVEMLCGPIVVALVVWSVIAWRQTRELTPIPSLSELDHDEQQWYTESEHWEEKHRR